VQTVIYAGVGGYLAVAVGACRRVPSLHSRRRSGPTFFTQTEYATLAAACERILPHDDEDPGAIDLGVPTYIDRAFAHDDYERWADGFRKGLHDLDVEAANRFEQRFHLLPGDDQDDVLGDCESGTPDEIEFFRMLLHLTLEGAFGDPSHGGNKNGLGWRLIGFAPGEPMPGMHHH
jgi:gluconate 2-dehydrogenase gamma chain